MSLADLIPTEDTPVTIGVVQFARGLKLPVYIVEFPANMPSFRHMVERYKRMNLDINPTESGYMFCVTSDRVLTELTTEKLDRALNGPHEDIKAALFSEGSPEFSSMSETTKDAHDSFVEARADCGGHWMLVVLMEDATELLIGPDTRVMRVTHRERVAYTRD